MQPKQQLSNVFCQELQMSSRKSACVNENGLNPCTGEVEPGVCGDTLTLVLGGNVSGVVLGGNLAGVVLVQMHTRAHKDPWFGMVTC